MIKVDRFNAVVVHIVYEPGDMTLYDILVMEYGDWFLITPYESTFRVPNKLNKWDIVSLVKRIERDKVDYHNFWKLSNDIYDSKDVNPVTVVQIARAIHEVFLSKEGV